MNETGEASSISGVAKVAGVEVQEAGYPFSSEVHASQEESEVVGMLNDVRAALRWVRTPEVRTELAHVLDLLQAARTAGIASSLFEASKDSRVRDAFRHTLARMTVDDRDEATDEVVQILTFAISADSPRVNVHLATLAALREGA